MVDIYIGMGSQSVSKILSHKVQSEKHLCSEGCSYFPSTISIHDRHFQFNSVSQSQLKYHEGIEPQIS